MSVAPKVFNSAGKLVRLAGEIGRGAEGTIFEVTSNRGLAAKVYNEPLGSDKAAKIAAMARVRISHYSI